MIYSVRFVKKKSYKKKGSHIIPRIKRTRLVIHRLIWKENIFERKRTPSSAYAILPFWGYEEWKKLLSCKSTVNSLYSGHCRDLELLSSLARVRYGGNLFQSNICNLWGEGENGDLNLPPFSPSFLPTFIPPSPTLSTPATQATFYVSEKVENRLVLWYIHNILKTAKFIAV